MVVGGTSRQMRLNLGQLCQPQALGKRARLSVPGTDEDWTPQPQQPEG